METLYGLYLAGGKSSRMGSPKWALEFREGTTFLDHAYEQLDAVCDKVYLSLAEPNVDLAYPQIIDTLDAGLLGGLLAAHQDHPEASWVVLACDLPAVTSADLRTLTENIGDSEAVAFLNPIDEVPEGTATYYTSTALKKLTSYIENGQYCARHFLDELSLKALPAPTSYTLQNVNYPDDYEEWKLRQQHGERQISIEVEFYAKLKQDAGLGRLIISTSSYTVAGLWEECRLHYNLSLKKPNVKPAIFSLSVIIPKLGSSGAPNSIVKSPAINLKT